MESRPKRKGALVDQSIFLSQKFAQIRQSKLQLLHDKGPILGYQRS